MEAGSWGLQATSYQLCHTQPLRENPSSVLPFAKGRQAGHLALRPLLYALCPWLNALCTWLIALCPLLYALRSMLLALCS
jgi:hypothetical protein